MGKQGRTNKITLATSQRTSNYQLAALTATFDQKNEGKRL